MGFSLADIVRILEAYDDREKLDQFFSARQEELEALSRDTAYKLTLLDAARKRLRKEEDMSYNVTLKTIPERYAATIRMIIPRYEDEGMIWGKLKGKLSRYGACEVPHASGGDCRKLHLPGKLHPNHGCLCCCDRMDGSERLRACRADVQDVKARILGNSIAERNFPYVIGLLQTEQMFANVYSVWYNSYRDVLKGIL